MPSSQQSHSQRQTCCFGTTVMTLPLSLRTVYSVMTVLLVTLQSVIIMFHCLRETNLVAGSVDGLDDLRGHVLHTQQPVVTREAGRAELRQPMILAAHQEHRPLRPELFTSPPRFATVRLWVLEVTVQLTTLKTILHPTLHVREPGLVLSLFFERPLDVGAGMVQGRLRQAVQVTGDERPQVVLEGHGTSIEMDEPLATRRHG